MTTHSVSTVLNGKRCHIEPLLGTGGFVRVTADEKSITLNKTDFGAIKEHCATLIFDLNRPIEYAVTNPIAMGDYLIREQKRATARYYEEARQIR